MIEAITALIVLAAVCVVAAIVGGDVTLPGGVKFPPISRLTRGLLVVASGVFACLGLLLLFMQISGQRPSANPPSAPSTPATPGSVATPGPSHASVLPLQSEAPLDCQAASIVVEPGSGSAGDTVRVTGEKFYRNTVVSISMYGDSGTLAMTRTNQAGAFETIITVPNSWMPELLPLETPMLAISNSGACTTQASFLLTR